MTVSAGIKAFKNLKQENCRSNIVKTWMSTEELQRAHPKNYQKMPKNYQHIDFNYLKTVYEMLRLRIFPVFEIYWECARRSGRALPFMRACPSLVSCYHNIAVRTFLKLMIMIEHTQMMQTPCLDLWSMLLSGQVPQRSNSSHLFCNLKDPVLLRTLFYRRKIA